MHPTGLALLASVQASSGPLFYVQVLITGVALGCIYALAGMGLVLTYKATGVFNFAHGAIAMIVAYAMWQTRTGWHWPLPVAAAFSLLVVGPGIGLLLERVVFRPLQQRGATTSERLVATLGVFLVCLGVAFTIWTGKIRQEPRLFSNRALGLPGGLTIGVDQLAVVVLVALISLGLYLVFRLTYVGIQIRAVVDRRELAEMASINANRVAGLSWAMGCGLAGLTGVLLAAQEGLDPSHLTLLVIETFSIAVVARLTSLPVAVGAGVLVLGIGNALLAQYDPSLVPLLHVHVPSAVVTSINSLKPYVSVVLLFGALLVLRNLDEPADAAVGRRSGLVSSAVGAGGRRRRSTLVAVLAVAVAGLVLPFFLSDITIARGQTTLALIVVFISIVCITGFCGYITLGQAGFAGFGAFVTARFTVALHVPVIPAMLLGGLGAMALGVLTGYPALKRRGLFLGLTSLGMGLLVYDFVFSNDAFKARGLAASRPGIFGISLQGDHAFYWFELVWVGLMVLLARNLRSGRLGRILAAMRDSEVAAQSVGINLRRFKLTVFAISAFIAGIGGSLLAQQSQVFDSGTFYPITSLLWFTVVIVAGVSSIEGAIVGGVVYELLDIVFPGHNTSTLIIALGALFIGYLPGGSLVGLGRQWAGALHTPRGLQRQFAEARARSIPRPTPIRQGAAVRSAPGLRVPVPRHPLPVIEPDPTLAPSDTARRLLQR